MASGVIIRPGDIVYETQELSPHSSGIHSVVQDFVKFLYEVQPNIMEKHGIDILSPITIATYLYGPQQVNPDGTLYIEDERYRYVEKESVRIYYDCSSFMGCRNIIYIVRQTLFTVRQSLEAAKPLDKQLEDILYDLTFSTLVQEFISRLCETRSLRAREIAIVYCVLNVITDFVYVQHTKGEETWYNYSNGAWMKSSPSIVSSAMSRYASSEYISQLGLSITYSPDLRDCKVLMVVPNFEHCLDMYNILVLKNTVLDRDNLCTRARLPSDCNTMKMNFDPCSPEELEQQLPQMVEVMLKWFGDVQTCDFHLDCLAMAATGRFRPRWAALLYGSGSDGKSTYIKAVAEVFGTYAHVAPVSLYSRESVDPNAATPAQDAIDKRLIVYIPDLGRNFSFHGSLFMQHTGSDDSYNRGLYQGGRGTSHKPFIIAACDNIGGPSKLSEAVRCKITRMRGKKMAPKDDHSILPSHMTSKFTTGITEFGLKFARKFGSVITYLIVDRIQRMMGEESSVQISERIRNDTRWWMYKNPVGTFCARFLKPLVPEVGEERVWSEEEGTEVVQIKSTNPMFDSPSLITLYAMWRHWLGNKRDSSGGIWDIRDFAGAVQIFETVSERDNMGIPEQYIPDKKIVFERQDLWLQMELFAGGDMLMYGSMPMQQQFPMIPNEPYYGITQPYAIGRM